MNGGNQLRRIVEADKTLLVDGPASVVVVSGKAEVFGFQVTSQSKRIVIREGKRLPFFVQATASFNLELGVGAGFKETEGTTIPPSWLEAYRTVAKMDKTPAVIVVVGGVDTGKSSVCTYLANKLVSNECKVAILDADLGQSDIGSPATVAYAVLAEPTTDLFSLKPENTVFVGVTSPVGASDITIEAALQLRAEIFCRGTADFVIVNTDGWAIGEEAVQFKTRLLEALRPDLVFYLQNPGSGPSICISLRDALADVRLVLFESPFAVRERGFESRRSLRDLGFAKYLADAKVRVYPLSELRVESKENLSQLAQAADNLLVALYDGQKRFLGIGVLRAVDHTRKALIILTSVKKKAASVVFGKVKLDRNLREIPEKF